MARKMFVRRGVAVIAALVAVALGGLCGCSPSGTGAGGRSAPPSTKAAKAAKTPATASSTPVPDVPLHLAFTGDMLPHPDFFRFTRRPDGKYVPSDRMVGIKPFIENADLAICHIEAQIGANDSDVRGYPQFSAPASEVPDLKMLGYDGCSTASNHIWDGKLTAFNRTITSLRAAGIGTAGTNLSPDQKPYQLYRFNRGGRQIVVAHVGMTYGYNRAPIKDIDDVPWRVNVDDPQRLINEARQARAAGATVVIASVHSGLEYHSTPSAEQLRYAKAIAASGQVDLLINHHTHVIEPVTHIDRPGLPPMYVYYGLGNMYSGMHPSLSLGTQSGMIAMPTLWINGQGRVTRTDAAWQPIVLDLAGGRVYTEAALSHQLQVDNFVKPVTPAATLATYLAVARKAAGSEVKEVAAPPTPSGPAPQVVPRT